MVTIRDANPADASRIADIWARGWPDGHLGHVPESLVAARTVESFHARTPAKIADTKVAEEDGEVIGFVMVHDDELEQIYVDAASRGSGAATLLLRTGEQMLADRGHTDIFLAVVAGNTRARRFYERNGWNDAGPFDHRTAEDPPHVVPCHRYEMRFD